MVQSGLWSDGFFISGFFFPTDFSCSFNSFRVFAYNIYARLQIIWRPNIWLVFPFSPPTFSFLSLSSVHVKPHHPTTSVSHWSNKLAFVQTPECYLQPNHA